MSKRYIMTYTNEDGEKHYLTPAIDKLEEISAVDPALDELIIHDEDQEDGQREKRVKVANLWPMKPRTILGRIRSRGGPQVLKPSQMLATSSLSGFLSASDKAKLDNSNRTFNDLTVEGGIYLGGTTSSNYIDDYEEGTYTVTCTPATSGTVTLDSSYDTLAYTKIGRQVTVQGRIVVSNVSSPSGELQFSLPFTSANLADEAGNAVGTCIGTNIDLDTGYDHLAMYVDEGENYFTLLETQINGVAETLGDGANSLTGSEMIWMSLTYMTA